jgi:hypothetical protein
MSSCQTRAFSTFYRAWLQARLDFGSAVTQGVKAENDRLARARLIDSRRRRHQKHKGRAPLSSPPARRRTQIRRLYDLRRIQSALLPSNCTPIHPGMNYESPLEAFSLLPSDLSPRRVCRANATRLFL